MDVAISAQLRIPVENVKEMATPTIARISVEILLSHTFLKIRSQHMHCRNENGSFSSLGAGAVYSLERSQLAISGVSTFTGNMATFLGGMSHERVG